MNRAVLLLSFVLLLAGSSSAATCANSRHPGITAVAIRDKIDPEDSLALRWWFHLRDAIDKSSRYCLVTGSSDSYATLSITATDTDRRHFVEDRVAVSFAAYFTSTSVFINHWLYVCGARTVDHCAETALADFDHELESVPEVVKPKPPTD